MSEHARAIQAFAASALGTAVIAVLVWVVFATPTPIGETGLSVEELGGMDMETWSKAAAGLGLLISGFAGLVADQLEQTARMAP